MGIKFSFEIKLIKFSPLIKMGIIKEENFNLNELKIKEVEGTTFMKSLFTYEGTTPVIEIVGEVRLYKNWFDGRKSYSVGIKVDDPGSAEPGVSVCGTLAFPRSGVLASGPHDAFDFKALESRMIELAFEGFPKGSFKLIKKNKKVDNMIYCKASTDMSRKPQKVGCRVSARKARFGEFDILCRVGSFNARLEICLSCAFKSKTCGFTLEARNIICEISS